ncbi:response regulator transcription factor [Arcobacter sp. FWKO B]|uniref:response regulator transcription factor n=1 Tax=Arcobacter sp. FWKO B TaxID=2593672 RepID=UPI0018A685CC|nr:response regulator transcription factor [Arcobacter sp. FWKO B]QOG11636.1 response regulator transcription factor [Arcobacter sp. FWKO B]
MKVIVYSKSNFVSNELKQNSLFTNSLLELDNLNDMLKIIKEVKEDTVIVLHHIDDFPADTTTITNVAKNNPQLFLIALSNIPENIQGCRLLQMGYKSYLHSFSNIDILKSAIDSVASGNIYVYPKLMEFLVSQVPSSKLNEKKLDSLTKKELEVLELVAKGYSNSKIATSLDIAEITVKKHISSMFEKLCVSDRLSLALILK